MYMYTKFPCCRPNKVDRLALLFPPIEIARLPTQVTSAFFAFPTLHPTLYAYRRTSFVFTLAVASRLINLLLRIILRGSATSQCLNLSAVSPVPPPDFPGPFKAALHRPPVQPDSRTPHLVHRHLSISLVHATPRLAQRHLEVRQALATEIPFYIRHSYHRMLKGLHSHRSSPLSGFLIRKRSRRPLRLCYPSSQL